MKLIKFHPFMAVGVRRLELPTSTSRTWRAANCATPRSLAGLFQAHKGKQNFSIPQIKFSYSEFRSLLSTGKCKISDLSEESILRGIKIEFFTWSSVDFMLNSANESVRQF